MLLLYQFTNDFLSLSGQDQIREATDRSDLGHERTYKWTCRRGCRWSRPSIIAGLKLGQESISQDRVFLCTFIGSEGLNGFLKLGLVAPCAGAYQAQD